MLDALGYVTLVSFVLAVVLAVARDVPILHLVATPDVVCGNFLPAALELTLLALFIVGVRHSEQTIAARCLTAAWLGAMMCFWWSVGWHLWKRR
jgi:hypothetical protein